MCTRYYIEMNPELRPIIDRAKASGLGVKMMEQLGKPVKTSGEIRPADIAPVIAPNSSGHRAIYPMVWGYSIPGLNQPVVNARIESASKKEVWRDGWLSHRCVIPASYYFEWEHIQTPGGKTAAGDKYTIQPRDCYTTWLAGIYRIEEFRDLKYPVFAVLTRDAAGDLRNIHDRMPLVLPSSIIEDWINPAFKPEELIRYSLTDLFFEKAV